MLSPGQRQRLVALFVRSGLSVSRQERFECSCCEFMVAKIPGQRLNCYLFFVYPSTSTDDRVFDCLCEAIGSIQLVDPKFVICFVGDFNWHHSEWLGSRITDARGVADFDFATVADTNIPDLCNVHVHGNVGRSDHASLGVTLKLSITVAGFDVARRVPLKSRVKCNEMENDIDKSISCYWMRWCNYSFIVVIVWCTRITDVILLCEVLKFIMHQCAIFKIILVLLKLCDMLELFMVLRRILW